MPNTQFQDIKGKFNRGFLRKYFLDVMNDVMVTKLSNVQKKKLVDDFQDYTGYTLADLEYKQNPGKAIIQRLVTVTSPEKLMDSNNFQYESDFSPLTDIGEDDLDMDITDDDNDETEIEVDAVGNVIGMDKPKSRLRGKSTPMASGGAAEFFYDGSQSQQEMEAFTDEQKMLIKELADAFGRQENPSQIYSVEYAELRNSPRFSGINVPRVEEDVLLPEYILFDAMEAEQKGSNEEQEKETVDEVLRENPPVVDPDDMRQKNQGAGRKEDTRPPASAPPVPAPGAPASLVKDKNNVLIDMNKQKVSLSSENVQPSSVDSIPDSRKTTDNKSEIQLRSDINYFFNTFSSQLKSISAQQKTVARLNKPMLIRLHKRILGILQPKSKGDMDASRKVGVVIDAEEYIKRKVNEVLIDKAMEGFNIPNLEPVGNLDQNKDKETKDIGSYEIKRGPDGGLNSNKEPVYRYIPTTQDDEVKEIDYNYESKRGPKRIQIPKLKQRNRTTTAQREVRNNPFNKKQGGHRLNVIL